VHLEITIPSMDCFLTHQWVHLIIVTHTTDFSLTHKQVDYSQNLEQTNLKIATVAMDDFQTHERVNMIITAHVMYCSSANEWAIRAYTMDYVSAHETIQLAFMIDIGSCFPNFEQINQMIFVGAHEHYVGSNLIIQFEYMNTIHCSFDNPGSRFWTVIINMNEYRSPPTSIFSNVNVKMFHHHIYQNDQIYNEWYHHFMYLMHEILSSSLFWSNQVCHQLMQSCHFLMTWEMNPFEHCKYLAVNMKKKYNAKT
jgi:hypothetical protein